MELPKAYDAKESEKKWQEWWEKKGIYDFDLDPKSKKPIYSVDTPPPTISGEMHIGHIFSYAQQDFAIRFQRMRGKNVFYPFGTDDNGLPTDKLVEKLKKVKSSNMDRKEYTKLVLKTLEEIRPKYIDNWKRIGMSCQWNMYYTTINEHCRKISQKSFIDLYKMKRAYRKEAPTMWCPACHTGISQVECEDKILDSFFNDVIFRIDGEEVTIATTRPELIPACVAVFYNPKDKRYKRYKGKKSKVPLFNYEVPVFEDERVDPEKGTGIVMCCTFGDQTDMEWQKAFNLPIRTAIDRHGIMTDISGSYKGLKVSEARKKIIEDLKSKGILTKQEKISHAVNVHERCGTEIEFIEAKQWFIKYLDLKDKMMKWGKELKWHPAHMRNRYENWVKGLQWDWLISRQRFYGIPFPVWYCRKCEEVIVAEEKDLPVDPLDDKPPADKCPKCGCNEFIPEKDIIDTWATSSLTPQLAIQLVKDKKIREQLYPMNLRPQAHDIITFWLFNTVVKSQLHCKKKPWHDVMISGWALDPHGKKMSKSRGNIVDPGAMLDKYNADAIRFWAAGSKLGEDLPFQEKDLVTGKKFLTKLWNASKFSLMHLESYKDEEVEEPEPIDRWLLSKMHKLIKSCTETFEKYEYMRTKIDTEVFFWHTFCDNYLEIIKHRMYNAEEDCLEKKLSAQKTLYHALLTVLKLMAPIMPHVTEEIYQLYYAKKEKVKSIHISHWPEYDDKMIDKDAEYAGDLAIDIISAVRKFKSEKGLSLKKPVKTLTIQCKDKERKLLEMVWLDIKHTVNAEDIEFGKGNIKVSERIGLKIEV